MLASAEGETGYRAEKWVHKACPHAREKVVMCGIKLPFDKAKKQTKNTNLRGRSSQLI